MEIPVAWEASRILGSLRLSAGPAEPRRPSLRCLRWSDPLENAFSLDVPEGWMLKGGMLRRASVDTQVGLEVVSPERAGSAAPFLQIASAVDYAHRNLVVHRDLKPGNIVEAGDTDGARRTMERGLALAPAVEGRPSPRLGGLLEANLARLPRR